MMALAMHMLAIMLKVWFILEYHDCEPYGPGGGRLTQLYSGSNDQCDCTLSMNIQHCLYTHLRYGKSKYYFFIIGTYLKGNMILLAASLHIFIWLAVKHFSLFFPPLNHLSAEKLDLHAASLSVVIYLLHFQRRL